MYCTHLSLLLAVILVSELHSKLVILGERGRDEWMNEYMSRNVATFQ